MAKESDYSGTERGLYGQEVPRYEPTEVPSEPPVTPDRHTGYLLPELAPQSPDRDKPSPLESC